MYLYIGIKSCVHVRADISMLRSVTLRTLPGPSKYIYIYIYIYIVTSMVIWLDVCVYLCVWTYVRGSWSREVYRYLANGQKML